jgi:transketolase
MKSLREEFANMVLEIGQNDSDIVVLVGDISHGIMQPFSQACPGRFYNLGIAESAMVNIAAGLSKGGFVPIIHTIAPFLIERSYEQIKVDFAYQGLSCNLVSVGGAFDYSKLGPTHHCYADISILSHFQECNIYMPGSVIEFKKLFKENYKNKKINYFKLTENTHDHQFSDEEIESGRGIKLSEGKDITIATTGSQLKNALVVLKKLLLDGYGVDLLYFHTLKPFDNNLVSESVRKTRKLVTIEELSGHGGLASLCMDACIGLVGCRYKQLAINGFVHGYGSYEELCEKAGLTSKDLLNACLEIIS